MKVDATSSRYQESPDARLEFNRRELRRCRLLLRRLRFLETKADQENFADANNSGGSAFAEWEAEALEWLLTEVGFLAERKS